jgi:hypothetical protein
MYSTGMYGTGSWQNAMSNYLVQPRVVRYEVSGEHTL